MNIDQAFPSDFLKAADLMGKNVTVTIKEVGMETIGQGAQQDTKPVISFVGKEKRLVCNKTNANAIKKLYGPDTDGWVGKSIILTSREVEFQGESVLAIRVSLMAPEPPKAGGREQRFAPPPTDHIEGDPTTSEEVPF